MAQHPNLARAHDEHFPQASRKPLYWALAIAGLLVILALTWFATHKSAQADRAATAAGNAVGTAYDPATGKLAPAGAVPGSLEFSGGSTGAAAASTAVNGSAGGTMRSANPQVVPVPGPDAAGAEVPPARLNR